MPKRSKRSRAKAAGASAKPSGSTGRTEGGPVRPHSSLFALSFLAVVLAGLALWTWRTWPDVIIDFGRELYVPWRIVEGDRLYGELAYFNGPLSPHLNAALFRLFGVSLSTLIGANLVLLATGTVLLFHLLRDASGEWGALAGCTAFLATCAFGQMVPAGNYNWITPYSHEATHGVLLGLASIWAVGRWRSSRKEPWLIVSGAAVGLAFLGKPETFLAAVGGTAAALLVALRGRGRVVRPITVWLAAGAAPAVLAAGLLAIGLGVPAALRGIAGPYRAALEPAIAANPFYAAQMGFDRPGANLLSMLRTTAIAAGLLAPAVAIAWRMPPRWPAWAAASAGLAVTALLGAWAVPRDAWVLIGPLLPVALLLAGGVAIRGVFRGHVRAGAVLPLAVMGLLLLAKTLLNARLYHYGFALAAPAFALVVALLVGALPDRLTAAGRSGWALRAGALALVAGPVVMSLVITGAWLSTKGTTIGPGADQFRAGDRAAIVSEALEWLSAQYPDGSPRPSIAVLPEGVMINYLLRTKNPTPYFSLMPVEMTLFGEGAILASYRAQPPDLILLAHRNTSEYGVRFFGVHYGAGFGAWLLDNYTPLKLFGDPPLRPGSEFGVGIMIRNELAKPTDAAP